MRRGDYKCQEHARKTKFAGACIYIGLYEMKNLPQLEPGDSKSFLGQSISQLPLTGINTHITSARFSRASAYGRADESKTQMGVTVGLKQFVVKHREASCVNCSNGGSLVRGECTMRIV